MNRSSLIMESYAGNLITTREELSRIPTPAARGRFHRPVPFAEFINAVEDQLNSLGLQVESEEHVLTNNNQRHFSVLEIAPLEGELIKAKDWSLFMAAHGSHDQSIHKALALGRHVSVCTNMCIFQGDIATLHTKHTTNINQRLPGLIYEACAKVPELAHLEEQRVEALKGYEMRPRWGDAALVEIHRRRGLSASQLGRAIAEWDSPSYEEFCYDGPTAWRLEQAVTQAVKPPSREHSNMFTIANRTRVATQFINELCGLAA